LIRNIPVEWRKRQFIRLPGIEIRDLFVSSTALQGGYDVATENKEHLSRLELLSLSTNPAEKAGLLFGGQELKGVPIEFRDSIIAGIALEHRLTLVTRNRRVCCSHTSRTS